MNEPTLLRKDTVNDGIRLYQNPNGLTFGSDALMLSAYIEKGFDTALELGADAVLICRPFVPMVFGGGEEGVKLYIEKLASELEDTMLMCGAKDLKSITREMLFIK